jgi:hypothetical protein
LNLRRGNPKSALEESQAILDALHWAMGGSPNQVRQTYRSPSVAHTHCYSRLDFVS